MISIVVCSADDGRLSKATRHFSSVLGEEPHEIIGVKSPSSLCQGFNQGLEQSRGEIVVFAHDDVEFLGTQVPQRMKKHLDTWDVIGVAGTDKLVGPGWMGAGPPHIFGQVAQLVPNGYGVNLYGAHQPAIGGMQALDGLMLAFRRKVIEDVRWDEETFDGFHLYDLDCTFRVFLAGYRLAVVCDLPMLHGSGGDYGEEWKLYGQRFLKKHGANIARPQPYPFQFAAITVRTRQEALEVMTPSYLSDAL